jgi:hypothetical protein
MDKIFEEAKRLKKDPTVKSYRRHQRNIGVAVKDRGDQYPGAKSKAIEKIISNHRKDVAEYDRTPHQKPRKREGEMYQLN